MSIAITKAEAKILEDMKYNIGMRAAYGGNHIRTETVTLEELDKLRSLIEKGLLTVEVSPSWRDTHIA
jgi:hypothetical protein